MTARITSKQKAQISRLAEVAAGNATFVALEQISLDLNTAQVKIIARGGEFQEMILSKMTAIIAEAINKFSGKKHPAAELLEEYFQKVYGHTISLAGVQFPEKGEFSAYMAVPPGLSEDTIMKRLIAHFGVNSFSWQSPIADNINRKLEQKRPQGLYVFAHRGGDEPDDIHLNKSYDDAMAQNLIFLNPKEYLLVSGFHRYTRGHFMDLKGWTRTSSLWSGGFLVSGSWSGAGAKLYLLRGNRGSRHSDGGPREAVFT